MDYDDYYEGYMHYLSQRFTDDPDAYESAIDDMESYDADEWDYRGEYRVYLSEHPAIEFHECETSGPQVICVKAGTFCDHVMVSQKNAYWQN